MRSHMLSWALLAAVALHASSAAPIGDFKRPCDGVNYAWCDHTKGLEVCLTELCCEHLNHCPRNVSIYSWLT